MNKKISLLKSELEDKVIQVNLLLKALKDEGLIVKVDSSVDIVDDSSVTERFYPFIEVNLALPL